MTPSNEPAPITPGWSVPRFVNVPGYPDDMVAGVALAAPATSNTGDSITVAHPQYPNQRHSLNVWQGRNAEGLLIVFEVTPVSRTVRVW